MTRDELVERIDECRANLEEAEWALREYDRAHPPPPCEGPFCIRGVREWMEKMERVDTPLVARFVTGADTGTSGGSVVVDE